MSQPYTQKLSRLTIGSLDDIELTVSAHYNPKEIDWSRNVPWKPIGADNKPKKNEPMKQINDVEFTGGEGRSMSLELLFDGFEENRSVAGEIAILDQLARVRKGGSSDPDYRRPHQCVIVWGGTKEKEYIPSMRCVIESITVKYTMFDVMGRPVRAVANVKLREAIVKKKAAAVERDDGHIERLGARRDWESSRTEKPKRR
jgi:hypothetical protein